MSTKCTVSCTFWLQFRDFFHILNHWRLCSTEPFNFELNYLTQVIETHARLIHTLSANVKKIDYSTHALFEILVYKIKS